MPSPKPEPNETGHVRPGGEKRSPINDALKRCLQNKTLRLPVYLQKRALTFKEEDGEHDAHAEASHCEGEEKKKKVRVA